MAVTIDPRPTVFGDRLIITGSYEAGDTLIDLSSQLASIDAITVNPDGAHSVRVKEADATGGVSYTATIFLLKDIATFRGTDIEVVPPNLSLTTRAGTFLAIGRRS